MVFVEYAQLDMDDGCFVAIDASGVRTVIPVGGIACLMLEPGTRVSHRAAALAARAGTLLVWVGEGAVRLYSAGRPGGARADKLLWQAKIALDEAARLRVVRMGWTGADEPTIPATGPPPTFPTAVCHRPPPACTG
jgi:CRISP-associated protein Cas1